MPWGSTILQDKSHVTSLPNLWHVRFNSSRWSQQRAVQAGGRGLRMSLHSGTTIIPTSMIAPLLVVVVVVVVVGVPMVVATPPNAAAAVAAAALAAGGWRERRSNSVEGSDGYDHSMQPVISLSWPYTPVAHQLSSGSIPMSYLVLLAI